MSEPTLRLNLPRLAPAQAQKHVTVNEALAALDRLVASSVLSRTRTDQPGAPTPGDAYILPALSSGPDWSGFAANRVAVFEDGAWSAYAPARGQAAWIVDEAQIAVFDGTAWRTAETLICRLAQLTGLGLGTAPDAINAFAAKLNAALWTARPSEEGGTGDLRVTLNKSAVARVLSLLFQSNWSGRAEIGLAGSDDLAVRVSADGATWRTALKVRASDGATGVGVEDPAAPLDVGGNRIRLRGSHTPASAGASGEPGLIAWDSGHVYVCVAPDSWKRAALASW